MGWFWSDPVPHPANATLATQATPSAASPQSSNAGTPPPSCPMHNRTIDALSGSKCKRPESSSSPASCPVPHGSSGASAPSSCPVPHNGASQGLSNTAVLSDSQQQTSLLSRINPLNYMFQTISQAPAPDQTQALPTEREPSTIPKGSGDGNWEYPSPQQMYNALLRKGYTDTDITAVESMVSVHNFLNEGAWAEIVEWERRFGRGLARGWEVSRRGEQNAPMVLRQIEAAEWAQGKQVEPPTLIRFQGRPKEMTPRARMLQVLGWLYPAKFGTEPPFDRHDWYISRNYNGQQKQVRYVIDYYSGPPEPTGEPVFYLDVRPAVTVTGAAERLMRWGGDVWHRASGAEARETNNARKN